MKPPYTGQCMCGVARYRLNEEPLTVYACHCTDCQKRSGGAFGISLWARRNAMEVTQGDAPLHSAPTSDGRMRHFRICTRCLTKLWSEPERRPELAIVRAGTLDDTSWLKPVGHIWTKSAQSWVPIPNDTVNYEAQPPDLSRLIEAWQAQQARG
jgi:hypothetical protein